jgi:hypothetical protein
MAHLEERWTDDTPVPSAESGAVIAHSEERRTDDTTVVFLDESGADMAHS